MIETMIGVTRSRDEVTGKPGWQTFAGKRVVVQAQRDSHAAKRATAVLRAADGTILTFEKLFHLRDQPGGAHLMILLTDEANGPHTTADPDRAPARDQGRRLVGPPGTAGKMPATRAGKMPAVPGDPSSVQRVRPDEIPERVGERVIIQAIGPETPDSAVVRPLVGLLAAQWFGPNAAEAGPFLDGLAGIITTRARIAPTLRDALARVQADDARGIDLSIIAPMPEQGEAALSDKAALFVTYLLEQHGPAALRQFLEAYNPERRDQAALDAYQRPLGALEQAWLAALRRGAYGSAIGTFFRYLLPVLKPYWRRELEVLALMLLGLTYGLVIPLSGKYLIDTIIPSRRLDHLAIFILILVAVYALNAVVGVRRAYVNNWINQHVLLTLQRRMFAHLQRLSHDYYQTAKVGDVMTRLSGDLQVVQQALSQVAGVGVYLALSALATGVTVVVLSPLLGALILLIIPLFALSYLVLGSRLGPASRERQELTGEVAAAAQENLSAHALIKAFGMQERATASYHARLQQLLKAVLRLVIYGSLFEISTALAVTFGQIVVLGVGGYLVIEGRLTPGTLLAFIGLLPALFQPVSSLLEVFETVQMASGSMDRIAELLDEPVAIADAPGAHELAPLAGEIRFERVSFGYGAAQPVIDHLDLAIPAGARIAIVGPSGAGKSTLANLLLRFWDPEAGRILADGHDLRDVTVDSLRGQIGLVFQDTFVFDTTFRENVAIGRPDASDAEIAAAVAAARLDEYARTLPAGYDTVLGERGVAMSGGQRQRLAIARAVLRDPRLLILDEATSALDAGTEREIVETLDALTHGRTTISITHRLALAAKADHIYVLDGGRIVEQGTHAALVNAGGLYQRLYEEQTRYPGFFITTETRRHGDDTEN